MKPTIDLVEQRVHPEDRPDFLKVIDSAAAGATRFEHTYHLLLPDGDVKNVHALGHALQDSSGNREFVGAATDITSIKRAEEELRTSEAYLAEAQRLSQTGRWAWSPGGFMRGGEFHDIRYWSEERERELDSISEELAAGSMQGSERLRNSFRSACRIFEGCSPPTFPGRKPNSRSTVPRSRSPRRGRRSELQEIGTYSADVRMVPGARIELATPAFSGRRSTNELPRHTTLVV